MRAMRHIVAVAALCLLTGVAAATTDSAIERVTVYAGGVAQIERAVSADVAAGAGDIELGGLPAELDPASVQAAVVEGELRLGAVAVSRQPVGEAPRQRERVLRDEIDALQARRQAALDRAGAARTQITFIEGLAGLPAGEGAAEAFAGDDGATRWSSLWDRLAEGSNQAHERLRTAEREAERLQREIRTLQQRLNQLGQSRRETLRVTLPYEAAGAGRVRLMLSYRVSGPDWQPVYESRLDTTDGTLTLVRAAEVRQATGEDWQDVALRLSTVQPVSGDGPDPRPWWIDLAPPSEARGGQAADSVAKEAMVMGAPDAGAPARTATPAFAATYEVTGRVSVPADNQPRRLAIGTASMPATLGARVLPEQDTRAWLTARATWTGDAPLPAGPVARFRDGAYTGHAPLESWPPGAERTLAFGVDPALTVRFNALRDEAGESGWITTQSTLARRYRVTVSNAHQQSLPVTVLFRVPVPRDEAIEVTERFSRPPTSRDTEDRPGVHAWTLDLGAGATRELELGYRLEYPEGRRIQGL